MWLPQKHSYDAAGETGNYCKVTLCRIQEGWKNYNVDSRIRRLFLSYFTNSIFQKSFIYTKDLGLISLAEAELEYRYHALFLQVGKCKGGRRAHGQGRHYASTKSGKRTQPTSHLSLSSLGYVLSPGIREEHFQISSLLEGT